MKLRHLAALVAFPFFSFALVSCETVKSDPQPEREKLSSIPHNMPESWETQGGFPGMAGGGMR